MSWSDKVLSAHRQNASGFPYDCCAWDAAENVCSQGSQASIFLSSVRKAKQGLSARWVLFDGMVTTSPRESDFAEGTRRPDSDLNTSEQSYHWKTLILMQWNQGRILNFTADAKKVWAKSGPCDWLKEVFHLEQWRYRKKIKCSLLSWDVCASRSYI